MALMRHEFRCVLRVDVLSVMLPIEIGLAIAAILYTRRPGGVPLGRYLRPPDSSADIAARHPPPPEECP
jgi:hypothetical protein